MLIKQCIQESFCDDVVSIFHRADKFMAGLADVMAYAIVSAVTYANSGYRSWPAESLMMGQLLSPTVISVGPVCRSSFFLGYG